MEQQFDINAIVEYYKPNTKELSEILFPSTKYPVLAFNRVLLGKANLDSEQIQILANYLGVCISDLFTIKTWKAVTENSNLVFVNGPYKIRLNYQGAFLVLYKNDVIVKKDLLNTTQMSLIDFINYINKLIKKY